jgi:hypothetical protein
VERQRLRKETKEPEEQVKPKKKKREPKTKLHKKKLVLKMEDLKKKTSSRNRSPTPSNVLAIIPARDPMGVANREDKDVAVPQIVHSPIHVAL